MKPTKPLLLLASSLLSAAAQAEMTWSDNSLSLLYGRDYKVNYSRTTDDSERSVVTFEHASGHSWGDLFIFADYLDSEDGSDELYSEISPRLSLGKLSGSELAFGPVTDVLIATAVELGNMDDPDHLATTGPHFTNYLAGVGFDLAVPGFSFVQANVYRRDNDDKASNEQLTLVWAMPFTLGDASFVYDGFIDWTSASEDAHPSTNFTSQLKWDAGASWGSPSPYTRVLSTYTGTTSSESKMAPMVWIPTSATLTC
ncbi:outer membrane protein OmpK [Microbulbifer sp. VAAF005]|uniref:outer membrane protein OmpK n=1 Tax=Microbulbifer sp. VAAF005 TaxID=3034230 RepID=UPI0024AD2F93|nr:outer membrane protein OmpK [Microbulbifer sp. VAAF005]WHI45215.1 outer membrane protein OmpK [Microbulbifer sp. VAAF005]